MGLAWSMAALAGRAFAVMHQGKTGMWIAGKALRDICMAGHTGVGTDVFGGRAPRRRGALSGAPLLSAFTRGLHRTGLPDPGQRCNQCHTQEHTFHSGPPAGRVPTAFWFGQDTMADE